MKQQRMKPLVNNAQRFLDFSSYCASPGWAGYFHSKKGINRRACAAAANSIVLDYLRQHPQKVTVYSSLVTAYTQRQLRGKGYKAREAQELYARAINRGRFVQFVDYNYHDAPAELPIRDIELSPENLDGFLAVSHATLAQNTLSGGFHGHLFVVFEKSGLVIYPHDDCGYGAFDNEPAASRAFFSLVDPERFELTRQTERRASQPPLP
ncbi:hypothetical protein [Pseudomonas sessilinigenes]|uniref:Peptidase C58 YopT-type domain-containing protein n=1 Tax=Pseudomonas sessilinigenes TaxID=658629 RepID=A0ABX8MVK0_9PSED|nr:hypothetical protein [Pseudomonas sessilinigenes]AZC23159.1 hypothetical protein C4K39_1466 [Pseudomonas sessilinigenes]QXH42176.1 hypothetical protein KSS89_08140 [Pseudomonas sessilinigenes]